MRSISLKKQFVTTLLLLVICEAGKSERQCVRLDKCPELNPNAGSDFKDVYQVLRKLQCGFEGFQPKVWCEIDTASKTCQTATGQQGTCMLIKECNLKNSFFFSGINFVNNDCPEDLVCCLKEDIQTTPPETTLPDVVTEGTTTAIPTETTSINTPLETETTVMSTDAPITTTTEMVEETSTTVTTTEAAIVTSVSSIDSLISNLQCGIQFLDRIVGGNKTALDELPWLAYLMYERSRKDEVACGGTLITDRYVLTAAHCVDRYATRKLGQVVSVMLGDNNIKTDIDCTYSTLSKKFIECADPPVVAPVEEVMIHSNWITKPANVLNYDIALIRLKEAVNFTKFISPICLPGGQRTMQESNNFIVAGWGLTENETASSVKLKASIPLFDKEMCSRFYRNERRITVGESTICAGGRKGTDSCSGDSGGPLMQSTFVNGISIWFLVGVVSFGSIECGHEGVPALYTRVADYYEWIQSNIKS